MKTSLTVIITALFTVVAMALAVWLIPELDLRIGRFSVSDGGWVIDEPEPKRPKPLPPPPPYPDQDVGRFKMMLGSYHVHDVKTGKRMFFSCMFRIDSKTGKVMKHQALVSPTGTYMEGWLPTTIVRRIPSGVAPSNEIISNNGGPRDAITSVR
jgi:hypothetical protein